MPSIVYIATSLDGYIADTDGNLDWLNSVPNPDNSDYGFSDLMDRIDALVMGRNTFETVLEFGGDWPYAKPVFVLSTTLKAIPDVLRGKVEIIAGSPASVLTRLRDRGLTRLYVDGGKTIQSFLRQDLIDELIITRIPILLGSGTPLFGALPSHLQFEHVGTEVLNGNLVKSHYLRKL